MDYYELKDIVHAIDECLYMLKIDKNNEWAIPQLIKYFIESDNWKDASKTGANLALLGGLSALLGLEPIRIFFQIDFLKPEEIGLLSLAITVSMMILGSIIFPNKEMSYE